MKTNVAEALRGEGLVAILRGIPTAEVVPVVNALYEGGCRIVEVAFNPADANTIASTRQSLQSIRDHFGDKLLLGAGTVVKPAFAEAAFDSGAKFMLSPNVNVEVIARTTQLGMFCIPGAFTPTECALAYDQGADMVKLFPARLENLEYIKAVFTPLSHIPFMCAGGANEETMGAFLAAGAVCVGVGASILKPELIAAKDYRGLERSTSSHVQKIKEVQRRLSECK